jgi:hypothetical protein
VPSHLLIEATDHIPVLLVTLVIGAGVKALASVLRTWIEQASRTRRLFKSLEDAKPHQRPGIIMACGELEERSAGGPDNDKADGVSWADVHRRPPLLILPGNHGQERQGN